MIAHVRGWSKRKKIGYGTLAVYVLGTVVIGAVFGLSGHKNNSFLPQNEFYLYNWAHLFGPIYLNKAVLYLVLAGLITCGLMYWVARNMRLRPNRVQTAVELAYGIVQRQITGDNMDDAMARKWFPFIATLFFFILVSNLLGYIPLPVNTEPGQQIHLFGTYLPSFQLFAATTNVSFPLVLALLVYIAFNTEGVRAHGPAGYLKSLIPAGVGGAMLILIFPIEILSNILRLLSLTIRLWANLLAGHMLISFMSGGLAVLLGVKVLAWLLLPFGVVIFLFEAVLIAGLQAFIFAILAAIYLGSAVAEQH
jgi:F-type H+-transporting ATPase subunit a